MLLKYWPATTNINFMRLRWPAFIMSGILIIASIGLIMTRGLNFGVDFAGGSVIEIAASDTVNEDSVRDALIPLGLGIQVTNAIGTGTDAPPIIVIKFGAADPSTLGEDAAGLDASKLAERAQQIATDHVRDTLTQKLGVSEFLRTESVGPKVSGELLIKGVTALVVALLLMLAYIWLRFEWQFSIGAVAALAHDVLLTIGMFSLLQLEFNLTTIAALLTIIGYSMNDTVVVFDRVREEMRKYKKMPLSEVINLALNGTLSRTLLTSGTTLVALLAIFFLGGPVLRGMSFALIWGIIIGTYSSIFVASAIVRTIGVDLNKPKRENVSNYQGV